MIKFNSPYLRQWFALFLFIAIFAMTASAQRIATVSGKPCLTQEMVNQYRSVYEFLLEIKLNPQQKDGLQKGLLQYWKSGNTEAIEQIIADVKYYGKPGELLSLRNSSQKTIVEAFRRDAKDSVSKLLIEAYDAAHPERVQSTKAKGFSDLIGIWKRTDGLLAEKNYSGQPAGVSYTETETIEIYANGKYKHIKVHSHYSGNCSRTDGKTEYGTVKVNGTKLFFEIQAGSEMSSNDCSRTLNHPKKVKPRTESFPWTIKTNPDNNNAPTLCWNTSNITAVCFEKQ